MWNGLQGARWGGVDGVSRVVQNTISPLQQIRNEFLDVPYLPAVTAGRTRRPSNLKLWIKLTRCINSLRTHFSSSLMFINIKT